jgi:hypothetical protein
LDLRLFEDGGEGRGALGSNVVARDTASDGQDGNSERVEACHWALTQKQTFWAADALEQGERRRGGQQLAQHDRSRVTGAIALQVELRDAVLAQGDERDIAEVGHTGMLQHHFGQMAGCVTRDVVDANSVTPGHKAMVREAQKRGWAGEVREVGTPRMFAVLVSGR